MGILLVLLAVLIVASFGLIVPELLWVGAGLFVVWAAGFVVHRRGDRWYRW
jgi:hypothetical protein